MPTPPPSAASIAALGVARRIGPRLLFRGVDLEVGPGDRVGIVGPNGIGKSSLLRLLAGLDEPDEGRVERRPRHATVGWFPQEPERGATTARQHLAARVGVAAAQAELDRSTEDLARDEPGAADRYAAALERWLALGGADLDSRLDQVLDDLGLDERVLDQRLDTLSGGQAAKTRLAALLLSRHDVACLDEPTNDLDAEGLARLEQFLHGHPGGLVVVSHDRALLAALVTDVVELTEPDGSPVRYRGGWDAYLVERQRARQRAEEAWSAYQGRRAALAERAQRQREWADQGVARAKRSPADNDKFVRFGKIQGARGQTGRARKTLDELRRLEAPDKPWDGWQLRLRIADAPRAGAVVARLDRAVVRRGGFTLGPVDLEVAWGERLAIVGPNGSGKSTLLGALLGRLPLDGGHRHLGPGVVVGELDQSRAELDTTEPLMTSFAARTGLGLGEARTLLAKFGLGADHVTRPADSLSPGERTRACLAAFQARGVNTLVLDEPTNHLDLPAIEQLEAALEGFEGTLLVVSHDRAFLDALHLTRRVALPAPGRLPGS